MKSVLFISHSTKDLYLVNQFVSFIRNSNLRTGKIFCSSRDGEGIKNGMRIGESISKNISRSKFIIYLITQNFLSSTYCQQELGMSIILKRTKSFYLIAPDVNIDELDGFINSKIAKFSFLASESDLFSVLNDFKGKDVPMSIASNSVRTFHSATQTYFSELLRKKVEELSEYEMLKLEIEKSKKRIETLQDLIKKMKLETDSNGYKKDKVLLENLFFGLAISTHKTEPILKNLNKDFWLSIVRSYEEIVVNGQLEFNNEYFCRFCSIIYSAYKNKDKALEFLLLYFKKLNYVYIHDIEFFVTTFPESTQEVHKQVDAIYQNMNDSTQKDATKETIDFLKSKM